MRRLSGLALALCLAFGMSTESYAEILDSGVPGMIFEHNVSVTMNDGSPLSANIYRPDKPGKFPVVMVMGPYGKDTHYKDAPMYKGSWDRLMAKFPELCKKSTCRFMRWEAPDPERWIPEGYIVVQVDSRGAGGSPGMLDPFSPRETEDYATMITWAARQAWSSGKVGLIGTSYHAINQWMVAARQPEGLAAILPWEGAYDHYREIANSDGIPNSWKFWFERQVAANQNGNAAAPFVDSITGQGATGVALSPELLKLNRRSIDDEQNLQPFDGAYYRQRTPDPSRITVPILCVGNWTGWSIDGYVAAASKLKWLRIHTGDHLTPFYSEEALTLQQRYFGHFLKGESNGWDSEPAVSLAIRRPDGVTWRKEAAWPLPDTKWERFYLNAADNTMAASSGAKAAAEATYPAMSDGVTFKTAPFSKEAEFTGPVKVKLWVRSTTADMDIFATLRLIDPQGRDVTFLGGTEPEVPAADGRLRASHRAVDPERTTEYKPYHTNLVAEPMTPGRLYEVDVDMRITSLVVPKGYRLAITVQGKDWDMASVKTVKANDYAVPSREWMGSAASAHAHDGRDPALFGGTNTVATGAEYASYLMLPFIPARR